MQINLKQKADIGPINIVFRFWSKILETAKCIKSPRVPVRFYCTGTQCQYTSSTMNNYAEWSAAYTHVNFSLLLYSDLILSLILFAGVNRIRSVYLKTLVLRLQGPATHCTITIVFTYEYYGSYKMYMDVAKQNIKTLVLD